ncbi:cytochrome P450 714C2-like [Sesamum indicum]|uniref:Cytochrome P450 714C2-like n=1 Tax=Sesamum indicum TaxID=4182 RepID=A0A6I9TBX2_SESIN|nr:cytochrome P450 714C2-like [Sesamum indicum]
MVFSTVACLVLTFFLLRLYFSMIVKPARIRKILREQGIDGPPPKILLGNILDVKKSRDAAERAPLNHPHPPLIHNAAAVLPFAEEWRQQYGPLYVFSLGNVQVLYVNNPDLAKEITTCTSLDLGRPSYQQKVLGPLLGKGILPSNGSIWARQRKIIAPELFMDKVKGMMSIITESGLELVDSWKHKVESEKGGVVEIGVDHCMKRFSGDIISRACFGSSYSKGQEIFLKFDVLQEIMSKRTFTAVGIPGLRHLPTKRNRQIWALEKEISALILKIVKERRQAGREKDLLQTLLEGAKSSYSTSAAIDQFIVDNCRNIYLAGFETSAVSASWCLMLLASNPEWQTRVRDEVEEVCQGRIPDTDMLRKMKQLHMVIQETMRLYPPAPTLAREAFKDVKIGNIRVPKGVNVWTMVTALHTDTALWGADALEFKPQRFGNGISGACKSPNAYMPFGFGQRVCVGQHLAMVELKLLMALILTNFSFTLSPNYVHSPVMKMIVEPKHGVQIIVKKL